jgi:hypothetical protein
MNLRIDALLAIRTNPMTPISHLVQRGWDVDFASCAMSVCETEGLAVRHPSGWHVTAKGADALRQSVPSQICDLAATLIRAGEQLERIPAEIRDLKPDAWEAAKDALFDCRQRVRSLARVAGVGHV